MNDVREFSVPTAQLSCLIGNLFAESTLVPLHGFS